MAEFQVDANKTVQMSSFREAGAVQRFKVFRRLYNENVWIELGNYEGGKPESYETFNSISVPTVYKVECIAYWGEKPNDGWKPSRTRIKYFHNPNDTVIRIECEDYWSTDNDWNDLTVQFILIN